MANNQTAVAEKKGTAVAEKSSKSLMNAVMGKLADKQKEGLQFPADYSVSNAVMSAQLILQEITDKNGKCVLETCSKPSIVNALLEMATQGLNPAKQQCYFIAYGGKLTMQRSYLGTIAMTKRLKGITDVVGYTVYDTDVFKVGFNLAIGRIEIKEYEPSLERDPNKIKGAFALIIGTNGIVHTEWMTLEEIKAAWKMGKAGGDSKAHNNFTSEMCKKTVINRACKLYAKTSNDEGLIASIIASDSTREELEAEINHQEEMSEEAEYIDVDEDSSKVPKNTEADEEPHEVTQDYIPTDDEVMF